MIIFTVQFDHGKSRDYKTLLQVFKHSCKKNIPDAVFVERKITAPPREVSTPRNLTYNTKKLGIWADFMREATEPVIFADCDMLCVGDPLDAFDQITDVGVTFKGPAQKHPLNGGIVFAKPTTGAVRFFDLWHDVNIQMYHDRALHQKWKRKYLGMNQAAFGLIWERYTLPCDIKTLATQKYNAVDCDWKSIDSNIKFVHIKSELRRAVLQNMAPYGALAKCMQLWYNYRSEIVVNEPKNSSKNKKPPTRYRRQIKRGRRR